jgi:hypothetical protein
MTTVRPTITDVSRAVTKLNERMDANTENIIDALARVSDNLAFTLEATVNLRKVTRRDVAIAMAAHGASAEVITRYAGMLAKSIRADFRYGRSGAII